MKTIAPFLFIILISLGAIIMGATMYIEPEPETQMPGDPEQAIPHVGSVEILNGSGIPGLADDAADILRKSLFDVKSTGNAPTWNYEKTLVISRIPDLTMARKIASDLHCEEPTLIRTEETAYDVTVIIGHNYKEFTNE